MTLLGREALVGWYIKFRQIIKRLNSAPQCTTMVHYEKKCFLKIRDLSWRSKNFRVISIWILWRHTKNCRQQKGFSCLGGERSCRTIPRIRNPTICQSPTNRKINRKRFINKCWLCIFEHAAYAKRFAIGTSMKKKPSAAPLVRREFSKKKISTGSKRMLMQPESYVSSPTDEFAGYAQHIPSFKMENNSWPASLVHHPELSHGQKNINNAIINGDNLDVLRLLTPTLKSSVRCI